jgi:hypothetical protein
LVVINTFRAVQTADLSPLETGDPGLEAHGVVDMLTNVKLVTRPVFFVLEIALADETRVILYGIGVDMHSINDLEWCGSPLAIDCWHAPLSFEVETCVWSFVRVLVHLVLVVRLCLEVEWLLFVIVPVSVPDSNVQGESVV